ncbi:MAG: phospholipase D family protein [Lachnospiraceae bacterium]|nr:phospholipase D family protein [Lachnospiraceae bacterium]
MLNPNDDRLDYGQVLAPPDGYVLDFAIGTTYSLDLDALVGASIALGLSEDTDSDLMKNPICLLEALRATGDKVALFCEAGQIHLPNSVTSLYILLEKVVFQVNTAKRKGIAKYPSFHPKFWLLRYVDESKKPLYRVVVLSRNLTFDRSWDITFCMDGTVNGRKTLKTEPVIDFLSFLVGNLTIDDNGKAKQKKIKTIMRELLYVHFELNSKEFEDFEFLPVGIKNAAGGFRSIEDKAFTPLYGDSFHEILIMSPFLTGSVIKDFNDRNPYMNKTEYMLFTRAMSLEKLKAEDCSNFRIFTMKDAVVDGESAISEDEPQIQKQDIHAKMYMVRKNSDSYLYLGSLNASHNAMFGNIEFMLMLKSKNRYLNLTKLSESLFGGSEDAAGNPFQEVSINSTIAIDEEQEMQSALESYIKEISRMKPTATVSQNGENYDVMVHFDRFESGKCEVSISPLLSNKTEQIDENIQFTSLQLTQLSEFYKFAITDGERTVQRVMMIPTEGLPEEREKAVVNSVVKDKECFYRYIAFLLGDNCVLSALEVNNVTESGNKGGVRKNIQIPALYEKMLQTAATAPERFKEIDYLIKAISSDGVIPEQFEELYNTFKKAVKL